MDAGIAVVIAAIIATVGTIIVAYINKAEKSVTKAEKSVAKAEKSIKEVSGALPSWNLLFEHDEQGNPISGNVESLIEAVSKGYPMKVRIHEPNNSIQVMEAQWLFVENKIVYASNIDQISLMRNKSGDYVYQEDSYHYYVIVGSDGHHHATRIFVDGRKRSTTDSKRHMAWIGLIPPQSL
jgi:hypothetical protein